jgi:hypothetical protein
VEGVERMERGERVEEVEGEDRVERVQLDIKAHTIAKSAPIQCDCMMYF